MNEPTPIVAATSEPWFRPCLFLLGLALGLVLCTLAGRYVARHDYHPGFTRFHPAISPEGLYYPTVDEMCAIVRARCRPDQVLVIVGGNSILFGVGQPADRRWTLELQRRLGDRFVVINFAFRGALATDGGAVIAECLRQEFPRQIYVANLAPLGTLEPVGVEPYRYIFREAYTRGLLEEFAPRDQRVSDFLSLYHSWSERFETRGAAQADALLRYRDLWNWVGFTRFFTVSSFYTPRWPGLIRPRRELPDAETDLEAFAFDSDARFGPAKEAAEMAITRGFTSGNYIKARGGDWVLLPAKREDFLATARVGFPDSLKKRTLLLVSRNSPFYRKKLTADEQLREEAGYRDTVALLESTGYSAMEYGRDFAETDFGDRTHLTSAGGIRLAAVVAPKVEAIAREKGYLK